jgi:hypothetical protein
MESLGELLFAQQPTRQAKVGATGHARTTPATMRAAKDRGPGFQAYDRSKEGFEYYELGAGRTMTLDEIKDMPGVSAPVGFWDPCNFMKDGMKERSVSYLREVELKNGRCAMLGAAGFLLSEVFHPFGTFAGLYDENEIAVAANAMQGSAMGGSTLQGSFGFTLFVLSLAEFLLFQFFYFSETKSSDWRPGHEPGKFPTYGWDPLGLRPRDPAALKQMKTKELNNGRLAMLGFLGMLVQEAVGNGPIMR